MQQQETEDTYAELFVHNPLKCDRDYPDAQAIMLDNSCFHPHTHFTRLEFSVCRSWLKWIIEKGPQYIECFNDSFVKKANDLFETATTLFETNVRVQNPTIVPATTTTHRFDGGLEVPDVPTCIESVKPETGSSGIQKKKNLACKSDLNSFRELLDIWIQKSSTQVTEDFDEYQKELANCFNARANGTFYNCDVELKDRSPFH